MSDGPFWVRSTDDLDDALARPIAVLYKHSPHCGASRFAAEEVRRFGRAHPDVPVFVLDVIEFRALAREAADRLGVRHASPQVIVLRDGRPEWDASHGAVSAAAVARAAAPGDD